MMAGYWGSGFEMERQNLSFQGTDKFLVRYIFKNDKKLLAQIT
jgi:hypothetical protein